METDRPQAKFWSNAQSYTMAGICLMLGLAVGYLVHAPAVASSGAPAAMVAPPSTAPAAISGGMPSAQDLKRMADKQVAPLLEQLQKDPKNPELLVKIGSAYLAGRQFQSARQFLQQSVEVKPAAETLNELAFVHYSMGDIDPAIATLNRALKQDPKNPKLLFNLGMFEWHGKSDPKAAIAAWQAFLSANPEDPKRPQVEHMIAQAKQHLNIAPGTKTSKPVM
jgi:cytochrome c-type biogenesis protein CcmH/NrfG